MSGDVQPRKRKDKKRKKDELGVEETGPRGTAAALGEGDVFMHSQSEHGTGGHWCAKIIFFSLLAVLVTLVGLIILENRGLSELEANSVETRYSGVLEGWLEDAPDDDHHDKHTLELKHHDDEEDDHNPEIDQDDNEHGEMDDHDEDGDDDEHEVDNHDNEDDDESENNDEDDEDDEHDQQDDENSVKQNLEETDEDDDNEEHNYGKYYESGEDEKEDGNDNDDENDEDDNDDLQRVDENNSAEDDDDEDEQNEEPNNQSVENDDDFEGDDDHSDENDQDDNESRENEEEEHEEEAEDLGVEVERLEKEVSDEDALSEELPTTEAEEDDDSEEVSGELASEDDGDADDVGDGVAEDEEFLEPDDIEEALPIIENIVAPKGKPLVEVEEEASTVKPTDTLADEEEYEKQQEELRREQEQASHLWLKLLVGGALLAATHAVLHRATAPRDGTPASDEHASREETPVIDRRMTLISDETAAAAASKQVIEEIVQPIVEEKIFGKVSSFIKSAPPHMDESEEEEEEEIEDEIEINTKSITAAQPTKEEDTENKELYSDEEEPEDEKEEEEIVKELVKEAPKQYAPAAQKVVEPEPEVDEDDDDVEIIDDEQLEEELEEEEDISDVDDAELLSRLEAKYGRLPEPDRPGQKHKDAGNSIEDDWPGEPSDQYWREQLDQAGHELRQGEWSAASVRAAAEQLKGSARARWLLARALDAAAEARRDNRLLTRAITAYLDVLKMNERLADNKLLEVAQRTLDRIRFRGNYLSAEPVYRLLIRRFPDVPDYYNNLTVSFLMANRADLAEQVIKDTLQKWPDDRIALAHHGFILKTQHNRHEEAVDAFQKALKGDIGPATEPRFYYHLGDSLLLLGRYAEAHEIHKRGAALGHFLSPAQRSLYNVDRLKSQPWWNIEQTPYSKLARALEKSWKEILKEGEAAKALYEKEKEGLKERGEWSQLDLFVRGQEIPNSCKSAPVTCSIVRSEVAAAGCRRGQIKFSAMEAGTHVRPHVGPTNCRLRMHLGLSNTKDTFIRVDQETRQWKVGKTLMFDDSFEHEVWHNGTGTRLVLIVDVWHPALTPHERRDLPSI